MNATVRARVEDVLANLPPGLIESKDYPELVRKVRITLNAEDVTARCRAFSLDPGMVILYVRTETDRPVLESVCGCGVGPLNRAKWCTICGGVIVIRAKTEERRGAVEVTPMEYAP